MKLKNKINLYTVVLFALLLLIMNLSVYFLFSRQLVNTQLDIARKEVVKTAEAFNDYDGAIPERELLRAYVPVSGMIRIVRENVKNTVTTTSPTEQNLSKQRAVYYQKEVNKQFDIGSHSYIFSSMPIVLQDGNVASLQIYKNIDATTAMSKTLRLVLTLVTFLVLLPTIISSRVLSNFIIHPISSMIKTMSDIKDSGQFKRLTIKQQSGDELQQMGETFNHMIDLLETNFEKQKQFAANASHELRTPLTVIESYASLLKRRGLQDPQIFTESIEAIHSEAVRMRDLTEQLLLLAKHHEQWNIKVSSVNLTEMVQQTVQAFQSAYHRLVIFDNKSAVPLFTNTDEQKLRQLLYIFLDNAKNYSDEDIVVSLESVSYDQLRIQIIDKGIGISNEDLPRVLERFYRVDKARSRQSGGTGLGLSLAKEIAEALGVEMTLASQLGSGTTVSLLMKIQN
ncbi:sensor histidine kinase [Bacillus rubiinfantis]|uniref:sensor histidine kinase n=1 Tax=Bacillus rubiinfantis TaxID=1499680 RepID=UPI0005A9F27D|nr:HAMP domain-containing sensor histidine kinase [Bacillus rubiinfantis]